MIEAALQGGTAIFLEAFLKNEDRGAAKCVTKGVLLGASLCRAVSRSNREPQERCGPIPGV